jgi:hypothetical protein
MPLMMKHVPRERERENERLAHRQTGSERAGGGHPLDLGPSAREKKKGR